MSGASIDSKLLSLHFWVTVLRLLSVISGIAVTCDIILRRYEKYIHYDEKIILSVARK